MAITAGYGNTKFVDDAQVRLLDSFCWLLLFLLLFSSEKKKKTLCCWYCCCCWIPKFERMGSNSSRVSKSNSMRWKRDDDLFSKTTHPPTALGDGDDFVATFFSLSLVDDDRKITTTSLFFFFFFSFRYHHHTIGKHKNRSRKRRNN